MAATLAACGGGGGGGSMTGGEGSVRVAVTDAPGCYQHVWVTVEKVRFHRSSTAGDGEGGWTELVLAAPKRIDLMDLTNGVLEELGTTTLPAGQYSQIRLVLSANKGNGASSQLNAVQPNGGAIIALDTPSAQQSGLKLQAHFEVTAGGTTDILLDFDACKSIVTAGNGSYILKPVISVVPRIAAGIQGYVTTTLSLSSTTVAAQQDGATIRSTTPDATGKFSIPYLPSGNYSLVIMSDGRATGVITGVPAGTTTTTVLNGTATAIVLPVSTMADVTGTLTLSTTTLGTTTTAPITDADVRATQTFAGGPTILVGDQGVDSVLGTYRFRLPVAAPVRSLYGPALSFTADPTAAGKYTVEALATGQVSQQKPANISSGTGVTMDFNYGP
jgi:hypothetical protein